MQNLHAFTRTRALIFQDSLKRNTSSLTPAINYFERSLVHQSLPENKNLEPNESLRLYSTLLRDFASYGCLGEAKAVHGQLIVNGIDPDLHLWNSLVNVYAKCGSLQCAHEVFVQMPERDVVSWTTLIAGLVAEGYSEDGIGLYCKMRRDGVWPNGHTLLTALKACSVCLDLVFGTQLHAEVLKLGVCVDSALVDFYTKCGSMEIAERVFFYVPEKSVVLWHVLLNGYVRMGRGEEVVRLFCGMKELELKFSKFTLSTVFKSCERLGDARGGKVVHAFAIEVGHKVDGFLGYCLLDMYYKLGLAYDALKVFRRIKDPNTVAWSLMINCLCKLGRSREAAENFCLMRYEGARPNQHTLATIVGIAADLGEQHYCEAIHSCVFKYGFDSDSVVCTALITMYVRIRSVKNGWQVFRSMNCRTSASWNALLSGINDNESTSDQAPIIFNQMLLEGFKPDSYTFISILRSCTSLSNVVFGRQIHVHIVKNGLEGHNLVGTALLDMYAKSRWLEDANILFNGLTERDPSTWNVFITGYAQSHQEEKAFKCFREMLREGLKANEFTISSCLSGCFSLMTFETGWQLHSLAIKSGLVCKFYVSNALIELYVKYHCIEDAEAVFKGMTSRNTVSWNTIIHGYSRCGLGWKAFEAFRYMLDEGFQPDKITFIGVLSACSSEGLIEEGKRYFNSLSKVYGITPSIEHCATIVNSLSRSGKFSEAETFIEEWKLTQNALIWETILWACKLHGNVEYGMRAARRLFELEPEIDYNYISLSHVFAVRGDWDDVAKVRAFMCSRGIKKTPGFSWLQLHDNVKWFFAQDNTNPKINEITLTLKRLAG